MREGKKNSANCRGNVSYRKKKKKREHAFKATTTPYSMPITYYIDTVALLDERTVESLYRLCSVTLNNRTTNLLPRQCIMYKYTKSVPRLKHHLTVDLTHHLHGKCRLLKRKGPSLRWLLWWDLRLLTNLTS